MAIYGDRSKLDIGRDNMRRMGFRFRNGIHDAEDDWPIRCKPLPPRYRDGGAEGSYNGNLYIYDDDGKVWMSYPLDVTAKVRSPITYVLDREASPVFDSNVWSIATLSLRTRDRWLANSWMGTRPTSLRALSSEIRALSIQWYDDSGERSIAFTIGEIVNLLLDPVEVQGRRKRWLDFLKRPEIRARLRSGTPVGFYERDLSDDAPQIIISRIVRPHVVWLKAQTNGFQHPDPELTVYPEGVKRVALDHRPAIGSVLRLWGDPPPDLNGIELTLLRITKRGRWEAVLTSEDAKKIVV